MNKFVPYLVEICGEVLKYGVRELANSKWGRESAPAVRVSKVPETPATTQEGCPYCGVAKALATAHRYLSRATERSDFAGLYVELARIYVAEARHEVETLPADLSRGILQEQVSALDQALRGTPDRTGLGLVVARCWAVSGLALDMAERRNAPGRGSEEERR